MPIRSPIIVTVGHIDHGKTTLLDKIRGSAVTKAEPGMLTQHVGASYIPIENVKVICGNLLDKFRISLEIPGLLLLDTPGHAAFISLRKRGGSVSDLAILVVNMTEGFQEQTEESLAVLKEYKTPFVVAATKVDTVRGWFPNKGLGFLESFSKQSESARDEEEKRMYNLVSQLAERGFNSERFDRIENFQKQIAIVPCSGITGEGVPELLMVLSGLAQHFLKGKLELSEIGRGVVLEVKETKGFGTTADVILYDGTLKTGDEIVLSGKNGPLMTRVKALLEPRVLQELRIEKQFKTVPSTEAAYGIKIAAPDLDQVIPGSPLIVVRNEDEREDAIREVQEEISVVEFQRNVDGIVLKADTLGSLEAMIKLVSEAGIPIRKTGIGEVGKEDLVEVQNLQDDTRKVVLAFNVKISDEMNALAKDWGVGIFESNVIYRLIDEYKEWSKESKEREIEKEMQSVSRPCRLQILKGFVFRASNPAIFGVEVKKGVLKNGVTLKREDGKIIGRVKQVEKEGQQIQEARSGDKVAISMEEPTVGRQINEGDVLLASLNDEEIKILMKNFDKLYADEQELLKT
ncbi:MAG: translation initiation factor IF-2 [Candidatus Aenigmarchaeota archaeon]|nr:translation initiation factor IF-2 [Candidatus Aenigmarchaeota archaeon]